MTTSTDAQRAALEGCPRRGPGRPRSEEAERAILHAALDLLARHGVSGLSIEAVAAHACVAKTTVYRRWSSKTELVLAALAHLKGPVLRPPGESVRGDLQFVVQRASRGAGDGPEGQIYARLAAEAKQHPEIGEQFRQRIVMPRREVLYRVVRRAIDEGLVRPDADQDLVVEMLLAPVVMRRLHGDSALSDAEIGRLVDAVLAGWAPPLTASTVSGTASR
jgi:AcrR family transcriptional regulator